MQFKTTPLLFTLILGMLIFGACQKSIFDDSEFVEHEADYAFPLFSTTLSLSDLMQNILNDTLSGDTITVNPDQTMTLFYSGDLAEKKATDIFQFLETGIIDVKDSTYVVPLDIPDSVRVQLVRLNAGTGNVVIVNQLSETVTGVFRIPKLTQNGDSYEVEFTVPPSSGLPWVSPTIGLAGWEIVPDSNTLYFEYEAYLPDGTRVLFPEVTPGTAGIGFLVQDMKFSYMEGYWGYETYPLTLDTIEIDINQTNLQGDVYVVDPKVTMTVSNSWGFPTRGQVEYLSFIGSDGQEYELESSILVGSALDFNYPSWADGEVGESKDTDYFFDKNNSNIDDIFNSQPVQLIYEVYGISNALQDPSITGFITDSSVISLRLAVELLLEGTVRNFGAEQTLDLNFGDLADVDTENIESVEFKLVTENTTPIATELQIYFQDTLGNTIDSLFQDGPQFMLEAAPVDENGIVTGVKRTENFIPMTSERFDRIKEAEQAFLQTWFTTAEGGTVPVKLLANQEAVVKMGLRVKTRY